MNEHDKIMLDALVDVTARERGARLSRMGWYFFVAGLLLAGVVFIEFLPGWLRIASLVAGGLCMVTSLVLFATTEFGKAFADHWSGL